MKSASKRVSRLTMWAPPLPHLILDLTLEIHFESILFSHSNHLFALNSNLSRDQSLKLLQVEAVLSRKKKKKVQWHCNHFDFREQAWCLKASQLLPAAQLSQVPAVSNSLCPKCWFTPWIEGHKPFMCEDLFFSHELQVKQKLDVGQL